MPRARRQYDQGAGRDVEGLPLRSSKLEAGMALGNAQRFVSIAVVMVEVVDAPTPAACPAIAAKGFLDLIGDRTFVGIEDSTVDENR